MFLIGFPLLVVPFAVYNMIEFLMPAATPGVFWTYQIASMRLSSGAEWALPAGDLLLAISLLILFVEMLKATWLSARTIMDHILSTLLFIAMLIEFLLVKEAATGTFFLLMVTSFVDVIGGFTITIRTAQRNVAIDEVETVHRA